MKATGVVRRIDDLGRIVIPKEIRRTLRIRDGEPLEIFVDKEIIGLKKYSPMEDLKELASSFVDTISPLIQSNILITDRDQIVAISNTYKNHLGESISKELERIIDEREMVVEKSFKKIEGLDDQEYSYIISPILVNGDSIGLVILFSTMKPLSEIEEKLSILVSQFLGKRIEE